MCSSRTTSYAAPERALLLDLAHAAIRRGLDGERPAVRACDYPAALRAPRACFVTLHLDGELRGCIGTLEARRALVENVAEHAHGAAFRDPRFDPLRPSELERLTVHISILSPPEPLTFTTESDLLAQLRPGVDGLVLEDGACRGTFLPAVWEVLPEPAEFLRQLKRKAGLAADHWSDTLRISRYRAEIIP
jgi:AmmeMemoRadiSam system protein A